jgi:hypothetical protein
VLADSNEDDTERDDMDSPLWTVNAVDCWVTHHTNANAITTTKPNGLLKRSIFFLCRVHRKRSAIVFVLVPSQTHSHTYTTLNTPLYSSDIQQGKTVYPEKVKECCVQAKNHFEIGEFPKGDNMLK